VLVVFVNYSFDYTLVYITKQICIKINSSSIEQTLKQPTQLKHFFQ